MVRRLNHAPTSDRANSRSLGRRARRVTLALVPLGMLVAPAAPTAGAQTINFRQYTGAEGLPQAQVMGMRQDRFGYLWFATYGRISRFDGGEFRTYTKEHGLSANAAFDIVEDERGRLLVAASGGLCVLENQKFRCIRQGDGLVSDNTRNIA